MCIVVITIPGEAKRDLVNSLHKITGNKVELVIVQKQRPNHNSLWNRFTRLYKAVGLLALPRELLYATLLRLNKQAKQTLEYFRERSGTNDNSPKDFLPNILETYSVNSDEVFMKLKQLSPDLIVIWGSTIIKPHILSTGKRAINLHMGLCPYYRGAIANQHAVMNNHISKVGATIHYAAEKVDSGNILETITVDTEKAPKELFRELNDKAERRFVEIASEIFHGNNLPGVPQNIDASENLLLKDWVPSKRYRLARQIIDWEEKGNLSPQTQTSTPLQNFDYRL